MANIGDPERRFTIIPLDAPITAPEGPKRLTPVPDKEPAPQKKENV